MKRGKTEVCLGLLALACMATATAWAVKYQRLPVQESVALAGATHRVILTHEDLTSTTTNGAAQTVKLFDALAKEGVELVAMVLKTPFLSSSNTNLVSLLVTVGDSDDPDRYLTSTQVCSHDTEVYLKYGRSEGGVASVAVTTTNLVYDKGGVTNAGTNTVVAAVTPATGVDGRRVHTATTAVNAVATPTAGTFGLDVLTQGEMWLYFRAIKAD